MRRKNGVEVASPECHYICDEHFHQVDKVLRKNAWHQWLRPIEPPVANMEA